MSFQNFSIWINLLLFTVAAAAIWYAGTKLERYTDAISMRTQLGKAFLGLLLLAIATDLPEIATITTAVLSGNPDLALHNLFGSIIIQTAILAGVDILVSRGPLTRLTPDFALLIQGVGLILVLSAALVGISIDADLLSRYNLEGGLLGIGLGPLFAFAAYLIVIYLSYRVRGTRRWLPAETAPQQNHAPEEKGSDTIQEHQKKGMQEQERNLVETDDELQKLQKEPWSRLLLALAGFALIVLAAGWTVATVGETLAEQTGLGASFIGFTLLSIATSLPEISTATSAVRNGNYSLAYSNVFGSNAFDIALLLPAALLYQGLLFEEIPVSIIFAAGLGILMTCVFLWGLLERRDWIILRMGWDSVTVMILWLLGTVGFYFLR